MSRKRMAQAAAVVAVLSALSKIAGFAREQMIAMLFGATGQTDAYRTAETIATLVVAMLSGPLSTAFLPVYAAHVATGDEQSARRVASSVFTLSALAVLAVSVCAMPFAGTLVRIVAPGFSERTFADAVMLVRILLPSMMLPLLAAFLKSMLNTYGEFTVPGAVPILQNLVIIAFVSLLGPVLGIASLAWGVVAGYAAALAAQLPSMGRVKASPGLSISVDDSTRKVLKLAGPLVLSTLFSQLYLLVEKNLASHLPEGSIAVLSFADRLRQLPLGLFVTSVITVITPTLSGLWAKKDTAGYRDTAIAGIRYVEFVCIPASVGLMVLARPIVRLAFERGAFSGSATASTAAALSAYAPGLIGLGASQVIAASFVAGQETRIPVALGIGTALLNVVFDVLLVRPLGHIGLALANAVSSLAGAAFGLYLLGRFVSGIPLQDLGWSVAKMAGCSAVMGAVAYALSRMTGFYRGTGSLVSDGLAGAFVVGVAVCAYAASALALRCDEARKMYGLLMNRFVRRESREKEPSGAL